MRTAREIAEELKKQRENSSLGSARDIAQMLSSYDRDAIGGVNNEYINSFVNDANAYFKALNNAYTGLNWSNANDTTDSIMKQWEALEKRKNTIGVWLLNNKDNLDTESYNSLAESIKSLSQGGADSVKAFKDANALYSSFASQGDYDKWYSNYTAKQNEINSVLNADDFEKYSGLGDSAEYYTPWYLGLGQSLNSDDLKYVKVNGKEEKFNQYTLKQNFDAVATDEEKKLYNYYLGKYGADKAIQYLENVAEDVNYRRGQQIFDKIKDNTLAQLGYSAVAGLDSFASGLGNVGKSVIGLVKDGEQKPLPTTAIQYASGMVRDDLANEGFKIGKQSISQIAYDLGNTTANQIPSMAIGVMTSPVVGAILMGTSAGGNAYKEMKDLGYTDGQATTYGMITGVLEGVLGNILGSVSGIGKNLLGKTAMKSLAKGVNSAAFRAALNFGSEMVSEGIEEGLQEVLSPIIKAIATGDEFEGVDWSEVGYSAVLGALSAGMLNSVSSIPGTVGTLNTANEIKKANKVDELKQIANTYAPETVAYKIADKVKADTGAFGIARLLYEVNGRLTAQNTAEIREALKDSGYVDKDADTVAEWLAKAVEGQPLTRKQQIALENNPIITKVFADIVLDETSIVNQRMADIGRIKDTRVEKKSEKTETVNEDAVPERGEEAQQTPETVEVENEAEIVDDRSRESLLLALQSTDYDELTKNMLADAYDGNYSIGEYLTAAREGYDYGLVGLENESIPTDGLYKSVLSSSQQKTSYELGVAKAKGVEQTRARNVASNKKYGANKTGRRKGTVSGANVSLSQMRAKFNDQQNRAYKVVSRISEATGIDVVFYSSKADADGRYNGAQGKFTWKNDTIYVDINSGLLSEANATDLANYTMLRTFTHEFVHFIEKNNAEGYNELRKVVFKTLSERGENPDELITNTIAEYGFKDNAYDRASREVIAEALAEILPDSNFVEQLAMENPNVFRRLLEQLKQFIADIKEYFSEMGKVNYRGAEGLKTEVDGTVKYLENIVELFDKVAVGAVENYQAQFDDGVLSLNEAQKTERQSIKQTIIPQTPDVIALSGDVKKAKPTAETKPKATATRKAVETKTKTTKAMSFKTKEELIDFINTLTGVELEIIDSPNQRDPNLLYTELPRNHRAEILTILNKYGIQTNEHLNGKYWIYLDSSEITKDKQSSEHKNVLENKTLYSFFKGVVRSKNPVGYISSYRGEDYITAAGLVLTASEDDVSKIKSTEFMGRPIPIHNLAPVIDADYHIITEAPIEGKSAGESVYQFTINGENKRFSKRLISFIDGGTLYYAPYKNVGVIMSINADGSIKGYVLGLIYGKTLDLEDKKPAKLKSFPEKGLNTIEIRERTKASEQIDTALSLAESGIGVDDETNSVYSLRYAFGRKDAEGNAMDVVTVGKKNFDVEKVAELVSKVTGRSLEDSRKWVNTEITLANIVMTYPEFLDFEADDRFEAIKKNSDYPQGTVDLSNLCPKRAEYTAVFDRLQKTYPDRLFKAEELAEIRKLLQSKKITVACGACFVEDRRQLLGEIAGTFIDMWKTAVETGKPLTKTNAEGKPIQLSVTAALAKKYGISRSETITASDSYIPTQYDLTTYEGFRRLQEDHPLIAMGYERYNNSRGQQAGRLIEGRAEYNHQILGWSAAKVKSVNNNGGLRIFSFSDFEVVHLLDIVQVIIDCAAMGVKIQGYTKIPAFAKLIRNTGIKLNRSLIPKGDTGVKVVNGKEVLDIDTVEGIDINDKDFMDEADNPDVGNIIIGINPKQIGIAMLDDFIDYIIPFHTNKSNAVCKKLGVGAWVNYKESQHEKDIETGKASKHNVNIYTEVIDKYHPTNKVEFVNAFLEECRRQKKIPRYAEFLNKEYTEDGIYTDEGGSFNYTYREGYHKFPIDFKMFDKNGNILPQKNIVPDLDEDVIKEITDAEVKRKQSYEFPEDVYREIDSIFGKTSTTPNDQIEQGDDEVVQEQKRTSKELDADYMDAVKRGDMETAQKMVDEAAKKAGYTPVSRYHQTGKQFNVFSNANPDAGLNDSDTPNGYFFKENDHDIGVGADFVKTGHGGSIQMHVYLKTSNMLYFENRDAATKWYAEHIPGYGELLEKYNKYFSDFKQIDKENTDKMFDELMELDASGKSTPALDLEIMNKYDKIIDDWISSHEEYSVGLRSGMRKILDDYFIENDSGYDGIELADDGHRYIDGKREDVHTYIVFDPTQIKSADPVTYNDDGNVIPLSERFNEANQDIRYQLRTKPLTDTEVLRMAMDRLDTDEYTPSEKVTIKSLNEKLDKLAELEVQRTELGKLYKEQQFGEDGNRNEAIKTYNRMQILDKRIASERGKILKQSDVLELKTVSKVSKIIKSLSKINQKALDEENFITVLNKKQEHFNKILENSQKKQQTQLDKKQETFNKILENSQKKQQAQFDKILDKTRETVAKEQRKLDEQKYREAKARQEETARKSKYREIIRADVNELVKWLTKPDDKKGNRIPDVIKNPIISILRSIDTSSPRLFKGNPVKATKDYRENLKKLQSAFQGEIDAGKLYSGYLDLPEGFMDEVKNLIEEANSLADSAREGFAIASMETEQLKSLAEQIHKLKMWIKNKDALLANSIFQHVSDAADTTINDLMKQKDAGKKTGELYKFFNWTQPRASWIWERFGEGGKAIEKGFIDAQSKLAKNTKAITDFREKTYTQKEAQKWINEINTVKLHGNEIQMPTSYLMGLYLLSKQEDSVRHLINGGFRVGTFTRKGKKYYDNAEHSFGSVQELNSFLDEYFSAEKFAREREVADKIQSFMAKQGAEWGNYVSVARFGEKRFTNPDYYPINSDGKLLESTVDEMPSGADLYALLNMSFTKARNEKATNRLIVYDMFDVFSNHVSAMAQYNAFALPILDALKWFNYKSDISSVRDEIRRVFGAPEEGGKGSGKEGFAETFVKNIIRAYSGTEAMGTAVDEMGMRGLRLHNMAQIAYNFRVVVQQPLSIIRAGVVLNPKYLLKAIKTPLPGTLKSTAEMLEHSGTALWKDLGFYDINISRGVADIVKGADNWRDKISDVGMKGAEFADKVAWTTMWNACKAQVEAQNSSLARGSDEYWAKVNELFDEVIYKTQVVDTVLTKSEFMRNKGFWSRAMSSFMSEPIASYSMCMGEFDKFNADVKRGLPWNEAFKRNAKSIAKTTAIYSISAIMLSAVTAAMDAARDDDEYEELSEKWWDAFRGNLIDELVPLNKLPIASDLYEILKILLSKMGVDTYGNPPQSIFAQWYDSLVKGVEILYDKISGEDTNYTYYGGIYKLLQAASSIVGLPIAPLTREVITTWNNTIGRIDSKYKVKTYDSGDLSNIKYAFKDGKLTEDEAIKHILDKGLADNSTIGAENEAYFMVQGWEYGEGYSRYDKLYSAAIDGDGSYYQAIAELTSHGYEEKKIRTTLQAELSRRFKNGTVSWTTAYLVLTQYCDKTKEDAEKLLYNWENA